MSGSDALGELREVEVPQGIIRYRERGEGPPLVFVHGLLVNGDLWRKVVPELATRFRCITPDLPLGSHELAMRPDADLTIAGLARLVADFVRALELREPCLIANDTGGAITQVVMTEHPECAGRIVLTSCDAFENFLPPMFRPLQILAHTPWLLTAVLQLFRFRAVRRLPLGFGWLSKGGIDPDVEAGYVRPILANAEVRRDCFKVLRDISPRYTLEAAEKLPAFDRPVLIVWSSEDRFFPLSDGRRLAELLPQAQFHEISDCYTFSAEDNPKALAGCIASFL